MIRIASSCTTGERFHCRELHGLGSYKHLSAWGTLYPRQHLIIPRELFLSQPRGTWGCYKHSFIKSLGRMMLTNILDAQDSPTLENCSRPKDCFLHVLRSRRDELCPPPSSVGDKVYLPSVLPSHYYESAGGPAPPSAANPAGCCPPSPTPTAESLGTGSTLMFLLP